MNYDRKRMKLSAKEAVKRTAPKAIWVTLVFWLLTTALVGVIEWLVPDPLSNVLSLMTTYPELVQENPELLLSVMNNAGGTAVITVFVSIVLSLYNMVMGYSYNGYALKVYRREETGYGELFSAFPKAGTVIGSVVMTVIYSTLWVMMGVTGFVAVVAAGSWVLGESWLWIPVYLVAYAGLILYLFWALYRYSMVPYFVMDQDMGVFEAIRASRDIMRGNKRKYFVLQISFVGWELLVALITAVVVLIGFAISNVVNGAGLGILMGSEAISQAAAGVMAVAYAGESLSVSGAVATVVALPLSLWLTAYQSTAEAGFYVCLTEYHGQAREQKAPENAEEYSWKPVEPVQPPQTREPEAAKDEEPQAPEGGLSLEDILAEAEATSSQPEEPEAQEGPAADGRAEGEEEKNEE